MKNIEQLINELSSLQTKLTGATWKLSYVKSVNKYKIEFELFNKTFFDSKLETVLSESIEFLKQLHSSECNCGDDCIKKCCKN
jgi:hypothetical protein